MRKELLKNLSKEQIAKVNACKNMEEVLALAEQEGIELTSEQLAAVSGGACFGIPGCPQCDQTHNVYKYKGHYYCENCGCEYDEDGNILVVGTPEHKYDVEHDY